MDEEENEGVFVGGRLLLANAEIEGVFVGGRLLLANAEIEGLPENEALVQTDRVNESETLLVGDRGADTVIRDKVAKGDEEERGALAQLEAEEHRETEPEGVNVRLTVGHEEADARAENEPLALTATDTVVLQLGVATAEDDTVAASEGVHGAEEEGDVVPNAEELENALDEPKIDGVAIDDGDGEKPLLLVGVRKGEVEGDGEKVGATSTRTSELVPCV